MAISSVVSVLLVTACAAPAGTVAEPGERAGPDTAEAAPLTSREAAEVLATTVADAAGSEAEASSTTAAGERALEVRVDVVDDPDEYAIETQGDFAVWWDPDVPEIEDTVPEVFELLTDVQSDATTNLGFGPLPTAEVGQYLNVYVHVPGDDRFPDFLGNGLGYSDVGMPYLAMPLGAHNDPTNVRHEAYHAMQSTSDYDVFEDDADAIWIIEASAEWYQHVRSDDDPRAFITAAAAYATPHLALWHLPETGRSDDPDDNDWLYGVRQYSMGTFLYYLTEHAGVDRAAVASVFAGDVDVSPQRHLFDTVGGARLGSSFADWAVATAVGFDYLTADQSAVALEELAAFASPDEVAAHVVTMVDPDDVTFSPPPELAPRSWAYNSIRIENTSDAIYSIDVVGAPTGSEGEPAQLAARVAVRSAAGDVRFVDVPMTSATEGRVDVEVAADDVEIYVVIASIPENFAGNEHYNYDVEVARTPRDAEPATE
ncbi:MAG: hypothetical protein AAFY28_10835 [Actinomycetota bacterium]